MTADDTRAFRVALRRLEIAFGCPVDPCRDPVYFDALEDYPIATVLAAARHLERRPPPSRRMPTTHDWRERCRELSASAAAMHAPTGRQVIEPDDDTPPMSKADFFARLDTLRRKLARCRPAARHHSSLTPLSQIADSLTHPHVIPEADPPPIPGAEPPREREPGEDDLPLDDTPGQPDGTEDDPNAI